MEFITLINTLILIFILIYLFKDKLKLSVTTGTENEDKSFYKFDDSFSEYEKKLLIKIHNKFYKYSNEFVPLDIFYTILWKESGREIFQGKKNSEIIGDGGNSIGFMQVNKSGALVEYNKRQNTNYKFEDLKDESINIKIGQAYIYYAIQKALKISRLKPYQWLVFKMYNGGLDETETSKNFMANDYANDCYNKFVKVSKFIQLNFS